MRIDFARDYDIVVVGGGIAGVAAAIAAAEGGAKVALVEKSAWFGGLATGGMIFFYLPIDDGRGHQVSFGLAEKLLRASVKYGPGMDLEAWKSGQERFRTTFSPAAFILALDELLEQAQVELWLDSWLTGCDQQSDGRIRLLLRNKGGNGAFACHCAIDATGDAELAREAGVPIVQGENDLALWGLEYDDTPEAPTHWSRLAPGLRGALCGNVPGGKGFPFHALEARGVTEFLLRSRRWLRSRYAGSTPKEHRFPLHLPSMADFRTAARIVGRSVVSTNAHNQFFADSIGLAADWSSVGTVQEIPFSALLPKDGPDCLIAAGRCISAEGYGWELVRSIPAVAVSGEAAGVAAACAVRQGIPVGQVPAAAVQQGLSRRGCRLHLSEVGLPCRGEPGYQPSTLTFETH